MRRTLFSFLFVFSIISPALSAPDVNVPEPLKPWVGWILDKEPDAGCPYSYEESQEKTCAWPGTLELNLTKTGGTFSQKWQLWRKGDIILPGGEKIWPQDVTLDGKSAVVVTEDAQAIIRDVPEGVHEVRGSFEWKSLPESLSVGEETGLVRLSLNGESQPYPERDETGNLWFAPSEVTEGEEDAVEVRVHRKLTDAIPFELTTRITLIISGKNREISLSRPLPEGFVITSLTGDLPARLKPDGRMDVQVRPGQWSLTVTARASSYVDAITLPAIEGTWAPEEVWVFEARPDLRNSDLEGVTIIDPRQTTLPNEWQRLPTFRMGEKASVKLIQKSRGTEILPPDSLSLKRNMWLDFDGKGFTVNDSITGELNGSRRLEGKGELILGRVSVNGEDQFITRLPQSPNNGVELRESYLNVQADSRLDRDTKMKITNWDHDFRSVEASLNLPAGWRVFHIFGADDPGPTWVKKWTLLDLFILMLFVVAAAKLWGKKAGLISLFGFALAFQEPLFPGVFFLILLILAAITRFLPQGRLNKLFRFANAAGLVVLAILLFQYGFREVRLALHPVLEESYGRNDKSMGRMDGFVGQETGAPPPISNYNVQNEANVERVDAPSEEGEYDSVQRIVTSSKKVKKGDWGQKQKSNMAFHDPKAMVQTGPGIPQWNWRGHHFRWMSPVDKEQTFSLVLIPPVVNRILAFVRVGLLVCLFSILSGIRPRRFGLQKAAKPLALSLLMGIALLSAVPAQAQAQANYPSDTLLEELKTRLLAAPACLPDCVSIEKLSMTVEGGRLVLRLKVHASVASSFILPGSLKEWLPDQVVTDGLTVSGAVLDSSGFIRMAVDEGMHQVIASGPIPNRESISIPLPFKPKKVEFIPSIGWQVGGLGENGEIAGNLTLIRAAGTGISPVANPKEEAGRFIPPFVRVERRLLLGLNWEVETSVVRVTPPGQTVALEIPLLEGESVTATDVRVVDNKVLVSLHPQQMEFSWRSTLPVADKIELNAPSSFAWSEWWELDAGPIWHVEVEGIPPVREEGEERNSPLWQPWPGEKVALKISRPEGVPGQTMTIDNSQVTVTPGLRSTDYDLSFTVRSSLGGKHAIRLPENIVLREVVIGGKSEAPRLEGQSVPLFLVPGSQVISVKWTENTGWNFRTKISPIDLGAPSVNSRVTVKVPGERWILSLCGPKLGPVVLFWPYLLVMVGAAYALSRLTYSPFSLATWLILSLGLSQSLVWSAALIAGWFFMVGWMNKREVKSAVYYNFRQIGFVILSFIVLILFLEAIHGGLLGRPSMQIAGNASSAYSLYWYQDRVNAGLLPQPTVYSLPLLAYHGLMLIWSVWLAIKVIGWSKLAWKGFSKQGLWRPFQAVKVEEEKKD